MRITRIIRSVLAHAAESPTVSRAKLERTLELLAESGFLNHVLGGLGEVPWAFRGRVLEVGPGSSIWCAPFYLERGAESYCGIDPTFDPEASEISGIRGFLTTKMPLRLGELLACFPEVSVRAETVEEDSRDEPPFDAAILLQVTEHLPEPARTIAAVSRKLREGGRVFIVHHNFYCWTGHHYPPYTVDDYDPGDPAMAQVADWNHVHNRDLFDASAELNFIRTHELLELVGKHFEIERLENVASTKATGAGRLTPEIRRSLAAYHEDELTTETVRIVGIKTSAKPRPTHGPPSRMALRITPSCGREGHCVIVAIPFGVDPKAHALYEDEYVLGPSGVSHDEIRRQGGGRYSIWGRQLYFSTSDNSDAIENGRRYELRRTQG